MVPEAILITTLYCERDHKIKGLQTPKVVVVSRQAKGVWLEKKIIWQ